MTSKSYKTYCVDKLRRLLDDMLHDDVLTSEAALCYEYAIGYAYPLVPAPNKSDPAAIKAYANLQYHATHPGAIFQTTPTPAQAWKWPCAQRSGRRMGAWPEKREVGGRKHDCSGHDS